MQRIEKEIHGNTISFETGRIAKQAGGSVVVRSGDSMVLVTACVGSKKDGDFLPLTVDYVEKTYAAGKIPGGYFKREGRLSERETLISRLIDRPCRPLFPEGFSHEIQVVATVISADPNIDTDVLSICGASAALSLSELPFEGPIAGVRVARIGGKLVINPTLAKVGQADLNMIVAGSRDAIVMVEGGADQVPEEEVLEALFFAHKELQQIIEMQDELVKKCGKAKMEVEAPKRDTKLIGELEKKLSASLLPALTVADKLKRRDALKSLKEGLKEELLKADDPELATKTRSFEYGYENCVSDKIRELLFTKGKRIDGRDTKTVRPITIEVGLLPRSHGSALFTRGETQAIVTTTLGVGDDAQRIDSLMGEDSRTFMLHYNFPPFSVGETKPMRGPGRREHGHGALAHRAIEPVLPSGPNFPYVIRIVSEITESNGSSSMASVCGASLSLMDAGIEIETPVAGVAMGLLKDGEKFAVLTDILGDEDHLGDMDFKVCGSSKGITAIQMDIKIKGLDQKIMSQALSQAREARLHILEEMNKAISTPRTELNPNAPRIEVIKISKEKVRELIGPGGKTIRSITESFGVKIDIADDGTVMVVGDNGEQINAALETIKTITEEAEIGKLYRGIVKRIADFGAFVEIFPGTDGLVHISQLAEDRVNRVTDIVREGDEVWVKVLDIDPTGKIRLSRKEALQEMESDKA